MDISAFQHSVFLQALGGAIINSLWQVFILWIIYETINIFHKTATSAFKNKLSTLLTIVAFTWFLSTFITGFFNNEELSLIATTPSLIFITEESTTPSNAIHSLLVSASALLPYLSISYIFLLSFLMIKLYSSYRYVYFIARKQLLAPGPDLQKFTTRVSEQMNIKEKISVWISKNIDVPATIGFLKPVILIPVASINSLSSHQLEAIILHELSHIKRNDYIINILISVIEIVLFFNPFVFLLAKAIKRERENCCDDFVIKYRYDPYSYATALLSLEQSRKSNLQLAMGAVSGKKQLLTRIKRITNNQATSKQFNYGQKLLALIIVTGIICSVAWLSPQVAKKTSDKIVPQLSKASQVNILQNKLTENNVTGKIPAAVKTSIKHREAGNKASILPFSFLRNTPFDAQDGIENTRIPDQFREDRESFTSAHDFKNSSSSFDEQDLRLKPLQSISNSQFKSLNINLDVDDLNKNLKKAFKEIKAMNWDKIQSDINQSLSGIDFNHSAEIEMEKLHQKEVENFNDLQHNAIDLELTAKAAEEKTKKLILNNFSRREQVDLTDKLLSMAQNNIYNEDAKISRKKSISISGLNNKNIQIIIDNITGAFNQEPPTSKNSGKPGTSHKLINIVVNDSVD